MLQGSPALPVAFCFAGQGAQYFHMTAGLMQTQPVFRDWMQIGDAIVQRDTGRAPLAAIHDPTKGKHEAFDDLAVSHPALFMVQFALAKLLQSKGIRPDLLLGVSLGEFVAMSVAGMIPFETALRLVARQPDTFRTTAPKGALIAALASHERITANADLAARTEIAGINGPAHCVLACPEADRQAVTDALRALDIAHQILPVPYPFHSRWIEPARAAYLDAAAGLQADTPFWPVWSSAAAAPVTGADPADLWQIVRGPMRLADTAQRIEAQGGALYLDLSPSGSLAAILGQGDTSRSPSRHLAALSPFGDDDTRLAALLAQLA